MDGKRNTKKIDSPIICRNCGTRLQGKYCHVCGQNAISGVQRTVGNIVFGFLDSMFSVDNKALVTLKYLLTYPGKLSKEYIAGHVVSYVHPSKLFWFISILFFALLPYTVEVNNKNTAHPATPVNNSLATANVKGNKEPLQPMFTINVENNLENNTLKADSISKNHDLDNEKKEVSILDTFVSKSINNMDEKALLSNFLSYAPYAMFLLIPFFAFLLYIFFRKKASFYVDHLIFSVHFHSFVFIYYGFCILFYMVYPQLKPSSTLIWGIPFLYFLIALYVFYRPRKRALIFKPLLILLMYLIAFLIVLIIYFIFIAVISVKTNATGA